MMFLWCKVLVRSVLIILAVFALVQLIVEEEAVRALLKGGGGGAVVRKRREPRLGDGCLLVFLDLGANIGVHTRFLFEPQLYPNVARIHEIFDDNFGGPNGPNNERDNRDICSFGFEPNPAHARRQHELEDMYGRMGWRYEYIPAGVSDRNGNLTFWHQAGNTEKTREEWGFSMAKFPPPSSPSPDSADNAPAIPEIVPLIRLADWIRYHIAERELPTNTTVYGNYPASVVEQGKVVMKMDVEGAEYFVFPDLLYSGIFCEAIDFCFGEFHFWPSHLPKRTAVINANNANVAAANTALHSSERGRLWLEAESGGRLFMEILTNVALKAQLPQNCKGEFLYYDSEAYLHDGQPWPTPTGGGGDTNRTTLP